MSDNWKKMIPVEDKPKIDIPKTSLERFLDIISFIAMVGAVIYVSVMYTKLPEKVPMHFNGRGEVDRYGDKAELWILPAIMVVLWVGLTMLERYPHTFNYMNLTKDNVEQQYQNARLMMNVLKTEITFLFVYICWEIVQSAIRGSNEWAALQIPIFTGVIMLTVILFVIRSFRLK
ncbi:DUF1648 domain-containing protein [Thalassobacillus hwangdonensis]|uniref:DUF1648 domain-containing protein n=1 Tax=Thalassobacillus hwangdonensis TaxID=546108 RepID=A0ABW3L4T0_9BACI